MAEACGWDFIHHFPQNKSFKRVNKWVPWSLTEQDMSRFSLEARSWIESAAESLICLYALLITHGRMAFNPQRAEVKLTSRPERDGEGKDHRHLWGQREVNSADTLQEPQAAVDHSTVFWLTCSEKNCRLAVDSQILILRGFTAHISEHVCKFPQEGKPSLCFQFVEEPQLS